MAQVYPSIEIICRSKCSPEAGELHILNFLKKNLPQDYEIYFQPFLNGDRPDIVVMRQGSGVLIIEVKDWNLAHYVVDNQGEWYLAKDNTLLKSPVRQVESYKDNLFNLHINQLLPLKIQDSRYYAIVSCAVYFHCSDSNEIAKKRIDAGHTELLGRDSLTVSNLISLLDKKYLSKHSMYFDDNLYHSFKRYLQPPSHALEEGVPTSYNPKQKGLILSGPGEVKIHGIAGSGKTCVLAARAVSACARTQSQVLILTFNITLRNYIHDRISDVRASFPWERFYIIHYHQFFVAEANNHGLVITDVTLDCNNEMFFERVKGQLVKYSAILVDEVQDFNPSWLRIVKKYFLAHNGEFVVFCDEKQNVYRRLIGDDKMPDTTVGGRWKKLDEPERSSSDIMLLALRFQKWFYSNKYNIDPVNTFVQGKLDNDAQTIVHRSFSASITTLDLYRHMYRLITEYGIHPNDICILFPKVDLLRGLDYIIRQEGHEGTVTTFESQEEHDSLLLNSSNAEAEIRKLRKARKFQFWPNAGKVKLSTIHSFKGWETQSLILIIPNQHMPGDEEESISDELIYTAITRCKRHLMIFTIGSGKYKNFFDEHITAIEHLAGATNHETIMHKHNNDLDEEAENSDDGSSWLENMSDEERGETMNNLDMSD